MQFIYNARQDIPGGEEIEKDRIMTGNVLVLGASGRFGQSAAEAFVAAGWRVTRFDRARDTLAQAVQGIDVVVNAWNPPSYASWARDVPRIHGQVIEALRGSNATVIVPGNVYVFGADTPSPWSETSPHRATNPLGRLRIEMEAAYRASGIRTILLRGGDFLDTQPSGNWFDMVMVKGLAKGKFAYPGNPDIPHAWAFLPDMARAAVALAEKRAELPAFADVPFAGYTLTGREIAAALGQISGQEVRIGRVPWSLIRALSLVMSSMKGLPEMRYLWDTPHALSGARLEALLPDFRATPAATALAQAVAHVTVPGAAGQTITA